MIGFLKLIGVIMAINGGYGIFKGRIYYTRYSRFYDRKEQPFAYWSVCLAYILVGGLIYYALVYRYG